MTKNKAFSLIRKTAINIGMDKKESFPDFWERMKTEGNKEKELLAHDMLCFVRYCLYKGDCRLCCCLEGKESIVNNIMKRGNTICHT